MTWCLYCERRYARPTKLATHLERAHAVPELSALKIAGAFWRLVLA